jgi:hypothetical protein
MAARDVVDDEQPYYVCPDCRERITADEPGVVFAREQKEVTGMGQARQFADGMGGYFHAGCSPEAVGYARLPSSD